MKTNLYVFSGIFLFIIFIPSVSAQETTIPDWIKNNAGWWADDLIDDNSFVSGIQWLITNSIIKMPQECAFESEEYGHLFDEQRRLLCDDFNFNFVTKPTLASDGSMTFNSEGFRGPEFLSDKPDNVYRIFAIGGSTTFGMKNDYETWPYYLQKIFDRIDLNYKVEVINAGISSAWSGSETKLIREKILDYNPDLLLVYDGWNDVRMQLGEPQGRIAEPHMANPTIWKENWIESCKFTNEKNIKTILTLQPFLGTGDRIMSNHEQALFLNHSYWINNDVNEYAKYQSNLKEISKHCTETKDLTGIYNQIDKSIYLDLGHVGLEGEKIVATHFFKLALPYIPGNEVIIPSDVILSFLDNSSTKSQHISKEHDLRGKNFVNEDYTNQNLSEYVFHISRFENVDFSNSELEDTDFIFTIMNDVEFNHANLKNTVFSRAKISSSDFSSAVLINTDMSTAEISNTKFTNAVLSNSKFLGTELQHVDFDGANLEDSVFKHSRFMHGDMKNTKIIKNMEIHFSHFYNIDFNGVDFSEMVFGVGNAFAGSDFRNSNLPILELIDTDFSSKLLVAEDGNMKEFFGGSNLSNLDFSNTDLSSSIFSYESNFDEILQRDTDIRSQFRDFGSVDLTNSILTGSDLSGKNLTLVIFYGATLSNVDLSNADLRYADLRNALLDGADLTGANLSYADTAGATYDESTILKCIGHIICD